jgi:dynein light chain roadblock-type
VNPCKQDSLTKQYSELIPSLADLARNLVRDLDPQNDLEFLRIRSFKHEIMVAASKYRKKLCDSLC